MKIDKEKFSKLKQLDRIEFRQRLRLIKEKESGSLGIFMVYFSIFVIAFFFLLIPQYSLAFGKESTAELGSSFVSIIGILIFLMFVGIAVDIFFLVKKHKEIQELKKEYFNLEVKK